MAASHAGRWWPWPRVGRVGLSVPVRTVRGMSLSSVVNDPAGPVRAFLVEELPGLKEVRAAYRAALPVLPITVPVPPADVRPAWATLGAAVDHRLRYSMAAGSDPGGAVTGGVRRIATTPGLGLDRGTAAALSTAGKDLITRLARLAEAHRPWERDRSMLLPAAVEEDFARACFVAAWFEEFFRSGRLSPTTPLGTASPSTTLADLLAAVPAYAAADMVALQTLAAASPGLTALRAGTPTRDVVGGPTFAGSIAVGGADADLIAGGLLLDVKTTADPGKVPSLNNVWQLAGYVLLDYDDEHRIDRVGWYLTRTGALVTWPLPDFLALLGATRPLPQLRARFADVARRL